MWWNRITNTYNIKKQHLINNRNSYLYIIYVCVNKSGGENNIAICYLLYTVKKEKKKGVGQLHNYDCHFDIEPANYKLYTKWHTKTHLQNEWEKIVTRDNET